MRTIFFVSIIFSLVLIFIAHHPAVIEGQPSVGNPLLGSNGVSMDQLNFIAILGGLVVFVFYFMKFGRWPGPEGTPPGFRPKPTRHFTTWLRYIGWAMVYGFFMLSCYFFIVFFPKLFINFLDTYLGLVNPGTGTDLVQRTLNTLQDNPGDIVPYAVIIVTVVWSSGFADAERTFRRNLQESALIPTEANRLIEHYEKHHEYFKPEMILALDVIREIPFKLISEETFTENRDGRLEFRYAQCEYMLDQISNLRSKRYFARVLRRYQEDLEEAKIEINRLRGKLQNYKIELLENLRAYNSTPLERESLTLQDVNRHWKRSHEPQPSERRYFKRMWAELEKEVLKCLSSILKIVICTILAIGKSPNQRNALLKKFGLTAPDIGPVLNREYVVRAGIVIVLTMFLCSGVYFAIDIFKNQVPVDGSSLGIPIPQGITEIAYWTFYAMTMHLLGIFGGYSVQKWLSEEQKQFEDSPSDVLKISDCAACFIFGFCLNIFLFALILFPQSRWEEFQNGWMYALVASVTAAFTGYYMTQRRKLNKIDYHYIVVQGLVTALFALVVLLLIYGDPEFLKSFKESPALMEYAIYVIVTTFLIGAALSYILQEWICGEGNGKSENTENHYQKAGSP